MPTEKSTRSRSALITRDYATYGGSKPVESKTLQQLAPKATTAAASGAGSSDWLPTAVGRAALKSVGRAALPKSVLRVAGSFARTDAPAVTRALFDGDDNSVLALAVALGVGEAVAAGSSVLVVSELSDAIREKYAALFPASAAACVVATAATAPAPGQAVLCSAELGASLGTKTTAAASIAAVVLNGASDAAASRMRHAASCFGAKRVVVVGPTVKTVTSVAVGKSNNAPKASGESTAVADTAPALRPQVEMNYFVTQGIAKFNLLHTLVRNSGTTKKILVRFATKEVASLYCDVLFALDVQAPILCDVEDDAAQEQGSSDAAGGEQSSSAAAVGAPSAEYLRSTKRNFEQSQGGCVLLSAYGLSSPKADVILEFDPPADLQRFVATTFAAASDDAHAETHIMMVDPSCHVAAVAAMKHHAAALAAAAGPVGDADQPKKKGRTEAPSAASRAVWRFKRLPTPSAATGFITGNKLRSLGKKLFTINNKGFKAYRSYVHYYALLRPTSIFDVYKLPLDEVAAGFGLEEAPLLDLRTKVNAFRPKEDYSKFARLREKRERRAFREYAAKNILPEAGDADEEEAAAPAADEEATA